MTLVFGIGMLTLAVVILSSVLMVACFFYSRSKNNYSIVDAVWAFGFFLAALLIADFGQGAFERRILMLVAVSTWSLRLSLHLAIRIFDHHPQEDGRYRVLRDRYEKNGSLLRGFFWFFQYQAWSIALLSAPFLVMGSNPSEGLKPLEWGGFGLALLSQVGEATADLQMKRFSKAHPGKTCNQGLWRYSRHPNYFFESLIWVGFFLMALSSPGGVFTVYCPLLIGYLLLKVTGVPMAEAQSLKSRGDEYREYQRVTSMFFLWFPRK